MGDGRTEDHEIEGGSEELDDSEYYVAHDLRPDTIYLFEVVVIDSHTRQHLSHTQFTRVTTKTYV
jgi:hypothetical protein